MSGLESFAKPRAPPHWKQKAKRDFTNLFRTNKSTRSAKPSVSSLFDLETIFTRRQIACSLKFPTMPIFEELNSKCKFYACFNMFHIGWSSHKCSETAWPSGQGDGLLSRCALHAWVRIPSLSVLLNVQKVLPGFEPGSPDSESGVLTVTPQNR